MKTGKFLLGMAMGAMAGAGLEMAIQSKKGPVKNAVSRTMESVSSVMENAAGTIDQAASSIRR